MQVGELYTYAHKHSKDWGLLLLVSAKLRQPLGDTHAEPVYKVRMLVLNTQRITHGYFTHTEFTQTLAPVTRNVTP